MTLHRTLYQRTSGDDATSASAWYSYDSAGRLWKKGYGNGDVVTHGYDTESRLLSMGITNASTPVLWYAYQWDAVGNITAITNNGTNITLYGYDRAGQLTNEVLFTNGLAGFTTNAWQYDEAGNWLNAPGGTRWLYNSDNELVARAPSGTPGTPSTTSFTLTGEVEPGPNNNKWFNTWAECQGVQGRVSTNDGTFSLPGLAINQWGQNSFEVNVRDVSGNTAQQRRMLVKGVPGGLETFRYDGNGNLTNWVSGTTNWVYEWDWADRLSKVTSNGITVLENWYDAGNRRLAKKDAAYALYLWDGWESLAVLNQSGVAQEIFTRGIGLAGDIGTLVAVTKPSTPAIYYAHHNHRGDVTTVRNGTTTTATYGYSAYGSLTSQTGTDVCRFKFSSKEREPSCGWSYYGYRFYAPQWQRFCSRDPKGETGGHNLYCYGGNIPITHSDKFGEQIWRLIPKGETSTGGNDNNCVLISRTDPIEGDPAVGKQNRNGQSACIWRCNKWGDQVPSGPPTTSVTFAEPGKPCKPPRGCNDMTGRISPDDPFIRVPKFD